MSTKKKNARDERSFISLLFIYFYYYFSLGRNIVYNHVYVCVYVCVTVLVVTITVVLTKSRTSYFHLVEQLRRESPRMWAVVSHFAVDSSLK